MLHELIVVRKSFDLVIVIQGSYVANNGLVIVQLLQSQMHLDHYVILILQIFFELAPLFLEIKVRRGTVLIIANQLIQLLTGNLFGTGSSLSCVSNILRVIDCQLLVVGSVVSLGILVDRAENRFKLSNCCVVISENDVFSGHLEILLHFLDLLLCNIWRRTLWKLSSRLLTISAYVISPLPLIIHFI